MYRTEGDPMNRSQALSQWQALVSNHMPQLSRPEAMVLACWSFGIVLAQSCGLTSVTVMIATIVGRKESAVRQQLREWCYGVAQKAGSKRGMKRQEWDVTTCFVPLICWILSWWSANERRLALAMDASTLGQRFTVLAISLIYLRCAIPVAWVVLPATRKGKWRPHWERLLQQIQPGIPDDWTVIVLADRGLYAKWLFQRIVRQGWHPFLRINHGGNYRPVGCAAFRPLADAVTKGGKGWSRRITCFSTKEAQRSCTLLTRWDEQHADPWLILTDLPPDGADVVWYGLRCPIESGFKDCKRGGWHWEQTKMTDPERATRLWLAMAVATLWVVSVGGAAEQTDSASGLDAVPVTDFVEQCPPSRSLSCFRRGVLIIIAMASEKLPIGFFLPEPWLVSGDLEAVDDTAQRSLQDAT